MKNLKSAKIPGVAYHSLTRSHAADTNHDRLAVQSEQEPLSSDHPAAVGSFFSSLSFLPPSLQCHTDSQCHLPFFFLKKKNLQEALPACALLLVVVVVFFFPRWAWLTEAWAPPLTAVAAPAAAARTAEPPAVWHDVKYSPLNCQSRSWFGTLPGVHCGYH